MIVSGLRLIIVPSKVLSRVQSTFPIFYPPLLSHPAKLKMAATGSGSEIPIVDFSAMSLVGTINENDQAVKIVADQLYTAFSTIGFVYLQNHGIPQETVSLYV